MKKFFYHFILKKIIPHKLRILLKPLYYFFLEFLPLDKYTQTLVTSTLVNKKPIIIYLPVLEWKWFFQRPQHLLKEFSKYGVTCVFCTPSLNYNESGFRKIQENLYLCDNVRYLKDINNTVVYLTSVNCFKYLKLFKEKFIFYDYVDDLAVFGEARDLKKRHQSLIKQADIITAVSPVLYDEIKLDRPDALLVSNGVSLNDFRPPFVIPFDLKNILLEKKPIVGFYGLFEKWLDYDLINYLTEVCRDLNFVFLGKGPYISKIKLRKNVFLLGYKEYSELKNYLNCFNICFIPFKNTYLANAASPVKLFEFFALGKPVVTFNIPSWRQYFGVISSRSYEEFSKNLYKSLKLSKDPLFVQRCKKIARENTWDRKARVILEAIKKYELIK